MTIRQIVICMLQNKLTTTKAVMRNRSMAIRKSIVYCMVKVIIGMSAIEKITTIIQASFFEPRSTPRAKGPSSQ